LAGLLQRVLSFRLPVNTEGFQVLVWNPRGDDSGSRADLDFRPRSLRETLADQVRWMLDAGQISSKQAGEIDAV